MSAVVKRNIHALHVLSKAPKKLRSAVLDNATSDLLHALCEIIHNVLEGSVKLNSTQVRKLRKHNRVLYELTKKSVSNKKKRQVFKQKGGFLLTLLPPALALLATLLAK